MNAAYRPSLKLELALVPHAELRELLFGAIAIYAPLHVHVVWIRDWFGPRWLNFVGKVVGAAGYVKGGGIPSFNPQRVDRAYWFERKSVESPWIPSARGPLNVPITSESNTRRSFLAEAGNQAVAAWIGGDGKTSHSVMLYCTRAESSTSWYVGLDAQDEEPRRILKGLALREYESFRRLGRGRVTK